MLIYSDSRQTTAWNVLKGRREKFVEFRHRKIVFDVYFQRNSDSLVIAKFQCLHRYCRHFNYVLENFQNTQFRFDNDADQTGVFVWVCTRAGDKKRSPKQASSTNLSLSAIICRNWFFAVSFGRLWQHKFNWKIISNEDCALGSKINSSSGYSELFVLSIARALCVCWLI